MNQDPGRPAGAGMIALRVWLWFVPVAMFVVSAAFSIVAALDGRWALVGVMALIGLFGIGLMVLHLWVMYAFGSGQHEDDP